MLLETGTEEIAHIEMLSTAVALNLESAPLSLRSRQPRIRSPGPC
jgi:Mn-containing catalase